VRTIGMVVARSKVVSHPRAPEAMSTTCGDCAGRKRWAASIRGNAVRARPSSGARQAAIFNDELPEPTRVHRSSFYLLIVSVGNVDDRGFRLETLRASGWSSRRGRLTQLAEHRPHMTTRDLMPLGKPEGFRGVLVITSDAPEVVGGRFLAVMVTTW